MQAEQAKFLLDFLLAGYQDEVKTTSRVIAAIPEDKKDYRPDPKSKTAMELAWHTAGSDVWFADCMVKGQFAVEGEDKIPDNIKTVADVVSWYEKTLPPLLEKLRAIPPEKLAEPVDFFGVMKQPLVTYMTFMVSHVVHHRGQLSTYLRPMGGKVPSIYGGSADEPFQPPPPGGEG